MSRRGAVFGMIEYHLFIKLKSKNGVFTFTFTFTCSSDNSPI